MTSHSKCFRRAALAALLAGTVPAWGEDLPLGFTFGPGETVTYDSNVFRQPSSAVQANVQHDVSSTTNLSANLHEMYGREDVTASATIGRVFYKQLKDLDYTQQDLRAAVQAHFPLQIDGALAVSHTASLAHYADITTTTRNVITRNDVNGNIDFPLVYDFRAVVGGEESQSRNSADLYKTQDFNTAEMNGGLRYQPTTGNHVDLLVRSINGTYINGSPASFVGPGYRDDDADLSADWTFSGNSHLHGRAGYVKHTHDDHLFPSQTPTGAPKLVGGLPVFVDIDRNFSGPAFDLTYLWQLTAATSLRFFGVRESGAAGDNSYQSAVSHTYRVTPTYQLTFKTQLQAYAEWSRRDYFTNVLVGTGQAEGPRLDHAHSVGITGLWNPRRWLQASLDLHHEVRDSTLALFTYNDTVATLQIQGSF